jgi:hypothetical protein
MSKGTTIITLWLQLNFKQSFETKMHGPKIHFLGLLD